MTRILVTGGGGFIGSQVVRLLLAEGHQVRVLELPGRTVPAPARVVVGDVRDAQRVAAAVDGVDVVLHQAAKVGLGVDVADLPDYADVNVHGTAVLLAAMAAAHVRLLVLASSMVVYGEGAYTCPRHGAVEVPPRREVDLVAGRFEPRCPGCGADLVPTLVPEDAPLDPRNAYAASKVAQEHFAAAWARTTGGTVVALRYHNVYGPGLPRDTPYAGVAAIFASALAAGRAPHVFEDGGQRRDFVHVRDVAGANLAAMTHAAALPAGALHPFNVGSGTPRTVGAMAHALAAAVAGPAPAVTGEYRLGDVRHITADSARVAQVLGWRAAVPFADGMADLAHELVTRTSTAGGSPRSPSPPAR